MPKIDAYLTEALKQKASDLHFVSGDPVRARIHGKLEVLMEETLTTDGVAAAMTRIMPCVCLHMS